MNAHAVATLSCRLKLRTITRAGALLVLITLLSISFFTVSSASLHSTSNKATAPMVQVKQSASLPIRDFSIGLPDQFFGLTSRAIRPLMPLPQLGVETVAIYQSDCLTPATSFSLNANMCAKITNAPTGTVPRRILAIVNPGNFILAQAEVSSATQDLIFSLPSTTTANFGEVTIDNRGTWRALSLDTADYNTQVSTPFLVSDPQNQAADLSIQSADSTEAGGVVSFGLFVRNNGPDSATNVQITDTVPAGATFQSVSQESGPPFTCTTPNAGEGGTSTCVISTFANGDEVKLVFLYNVVAAAGTQLLHSSVISSDTDESHVPDNTTESATIVTTAGGGGAECVLDCPNNIIVTADTEQGGQPGAVVTFGSAEPFGDCGTVTASPASGSFFPVGASTVTVTSSTGGGTCSFQVTVVDEDAPTISCPANVTTSTEDCAPAQVDPGTPTASPAGVTVMGERSDDLPLTDLYPVGVTTIVWTATDSLGRFASCTQTITVNTTDPEPPTVTAPDDITVATPPDTVGQCGVVIGEAVLGSPIATDNCQVNVVRTGVPAGNFFPVGMTTITYTATDAGGNTATDTQIVTVTDGPPVIYAPPDASYVCRSEVPAADPSQATGPDIIDANGNPQPGPPADSCGPVTVTVSETSTGAGSASSPLIITRTFTATDNSGQTASAVQTITVIDPIAPTVMAPPDISVNTDPGVCSATVNPGSATADDNCSGATVSGVRSDNQPLNGPYPKGITTIIWTAIDGGGNSSVPATQTITVTDAEAPTISCPNSVVLDPTCPSGAVATYTAPIGVDNCPGSTTQRTAGLESGSVFPSGTTTVTYTVTDAVGLTASCSFTVTVLTPTQAIQNMIGTVNALPGLTGQQRQGLLSKLTAALDAIAQNKINVACNKLSDFISQVQSYINNGTLTGAQGQPLITSATKVRNALGCTSQACF